MTNRLSRSVVTNILKVLSFLIQKGIIQEDQAFNFIVSLSISDTTIAELMTVKKDSNHFTSANSPKGFSKYYNNNFYQ